MWNAGLGIARWFPWPLKTLVLFVLVISILAPLWALTVPIDVIRALLS
jgi:hypothetical protein